MYDNEARKRNKRMLEDKRLSDEEWFRILYALQVIDMDTTQEEIDDCVLQYE
jgi:hypothetical protein